MFGLGFIEIIVVALVILLVVKPQDLPKLFKKIGKSYKQLKDTIGEVKKMKDDFVSLADVKENATANLTNTDAKSASKTDS